MCSILLVDDHPLIVEGYILALNKDEGLLGKSKFTKAFDCLSAKEIIDEAVANGDFFDVAIVDFSVPSNETFKWNDGGDIILYLNKVMPECKTLMITGHTEVLTIYEIVKNIRPDGLASKHEISPDSLIGIVKEVLNGTRYQSEIVKHCLSEIVRKEMMYDDYNRAILVLLSKGYKLQELDEHIPLSNPTIKKRLAKMKQVFEVSDTATLVQNAIKLGFV
ncbi:response regulator [Myroides pelagicus]|uniref:Response regulator n=1 Tax=Myroides pelagicus TaxID=270914 RepID=A0A7K1GJM3_9FLAO|nr:response regulator transcription factor [Myroides pelagicus]MEC4112999.1 response regulator transcription factor [Myroides pelagicus]MTH28998.1 response regulator [Myroides pelagicus]